MRTPRLDELLLTRRIPLPPPRERATLPDSMSPEDRREVRDSRALKSAQYLREPDASDGDPFTEPPGRGSLVASVFGVVVLSFFLYHYLTSAL